MNETKKERKIITAQELQVIMKDCYEGPQTSWIEFTDLITGQLLADGYIEDEFDPNGDYIWNQVANYWQVFLKREY